MGNDIPSHVFRQCFHWFDVNYKDILFDHRAQKLHTGKALLLFLEAAWNKRDSLDDIANNLRAKEWMQQWIGIKSIHGSTLCRKLEKLPLDLLQDLFASVVKAIALCYAGKTGIKKLGKLATVDSTEIRLPRVNGTWAYTSSSKNAVKMHTRLLVADADSVCPEEVILSTAAVSDQEVALDLVVDTMNTYVFDRGYINFAHYRKWVQRGNQFVARVKANNRFRVLEKRDVTEQNHILLDADVEWKDPKTEAAFKLRLVEYEYVNDKKQKCKIRVVTNRWDLMAEEISEIYRYRWKIELFFKWMKQHLRLTKLYSYKPEAVWNQIYLTLIAYALCELIRLTVKPEKSCWQILQALNRYADRPVEELLAELNRTPTRSSQGRRKKKRGRPRKHPPKLKPVHIIIR
ncbi:hypothetical protein PAE9249_05189 [Paenibacillus sp. CECT 9249]|uniref:IS4 family transposase n=1 Tax=Paenibacillus sp. CECT 9249 TaxID=2845385 RepID=UPI001E44B4C7|nr:IS4 family transposase [Paenibacillus sp. CECT 9249]CAH0122617.1 hypothetical protein PAE9249_05189 [Paenibacillus sp. CECT 9249]